ncbi:MAG: (2Fe-2S)-binding protein [Desulfofustis sp.]|nr:(2Fe-2S)-binding protein [Desulfofustis sp.]
MFVCICKQVTESQVQAAIRDGHESVESLGECLGVGTGCGSCVEYTRDYLNDDPARGDNLSHTST